MTRSKPSSLVVRAESAADRAVRLAREKAVTPARPLPKNPPAALKDHPTARRAWRYLAARWDETEGTIVTSFDLGIVSNFCLAIEQFAELQKMRDAAYRLWLELSEAQSAAGPEDKISLAIKTVYSFDMILKIDARLDRKSDLLHKLGQSLYLTPRSRAGVAPTPQTAAPEPDELEQLLDKLT